jgi:hypothetical protein
LHRALRDSCIQRFEFCVELAWNTSIKSLGLDTRAPNPAARGMAQNVLIDDPSASDRVEKDWPELTAFFSFPARHWQHLRTTNAIESTFATVRLRTYVTKGAGSVKAASSMAFKLLQDAERTWNRIRGFEDLPDVLNGGSYVNGAVVAATPSTRERHREEAIPA